MAEGDGRAAPAVSRNHATTQGNDIMTAISALQSLPAIRVKLVSVDREYSRRNVIGSHSQTAHVWAQNRYASGRSSDSRMFFDGAILYSYGSHFALGMVLETTEGRVTLLNSSNYSISTSKHKGHAWHAANGRILHVPDLTEITRTLDHIRGGNMAAYTVKQLPDFIKKHILDMPAETTQFLAGLIGKGRSVCAWYRAAEKARAVAKAKARAADIEEKKEDAITMADASPAAWARELSDRQEDSNRPWGKFQPYPGAHYKQYRKTTPGEALAMFATEMHRLNVTAKAHLSKKRQAVLKARLAEVRAMSKEALKWESKSEELATFRRYKKTFREYLAIAAGNPSYDKTVAETLARLATYFTQRKHAGAALCRKLSDITRAAGIQLDKIAAIESRERMERERAGREAWLAGENTPENRYARYSDEMGRALIRVRGETLETSHGAEVPLADAIKAFRFVKLCRERGQGWKRNGATLPVGHFQIDAIDATGNFIAGCHKIGWNEIARLAGQLGLADIEPADTTDRAGA
jgi:hypothetical protein